MTINVFIASSWELHAWRVAIGDTLRALSEEKEPAGYRIHMKCWEDFRPEYTGTRKQDEYNTQLIQESHLFIALFASRCGAYTQEEIRYWKDHCSGPFYCLRKRTTKDRTAVDSYLTREKIDAVTCRNISELSNRIREYVEAYIAAHPSAATPSDSLKERQIYATIPEDRSSERFPFGDMVRSLDDMAEDVFRIRCRLRKEQISEIPSSDYYTSILKDRVSAAEEQEILTALTCAESSGQPMVELYYNPKDRICKNHPAIDDAIRRTGCFNETYDNLFRVRYNLLKWLLKDRLLRVDETTGLDVWQGIIRFHGHWIAPFSVTGIQERNDGRRLQHLIRDLSFYVLEAQKPEAGEEWTEAQINQAVTTVDEVRKTAIDIVRKTDEERAGIIDAISRRVEALYAAGITNASMGEIVRLLQQKETLQRQLLASGGETSPREILRTMMQIVQFHDTYPTVFETTGYDIDDHYRRMAESADSFGIQDPTLEMMRMNYANFLAREERVTEALREYETAIDHIDAMDDSEAFIRSYTMHLYFTYYSELAEMGENALARQTLARLEKKTSGWDALGRSPLEKVLDEALIATAKLRLRPISEIRPDDLQQAQLYYEKLKTLPDGSVPQQAWDDYYCYLPNCIASTLMDAGRFIPAVLDYLDDVIRNAEKSRSWNDGLGRSYLGNAYHNRAFYFKNLGDKIKADAACQKALEYRRKLYQDFRFRSDQKQIAETLLLAGANLVDNSADELDEVETKKALAYADECLTLYTQLNTEGYLEPTTCVYKAKQLKGSILYYSSAIPDKAEAVSLLRECHAWNLSHPDNSYRAAFNEVSGKILKDLNYV